MLELNIMADNEIYISWESTVYPDGGMFEGLMKDGQCHGKGVFQYADGDRFEGEYKEGLMDGLGVYKWANGSVFFGQWKENNMHGCGKKYYPGGAIEEGEWVEDDFVGDFTACDALESESAKQEAITVSSGARMFMYKPDGEVSLKNGVYLEQHPVVYPTGEEFLMPGSMGAKSPVPEWAQLPMAKAAHVMQDIWSKWNFAIPSQAELLAADLKKEEANQKESKRIAAAQAAASGEDEEDDDEEDDEDDDEDDEDEAPTPKRMASISMASMNRTRSLHRSFEKAARRVVRNILERKAQHKQEKASRKAPPMACLSSLAFRL